MECKIAFLEGNFNADYINWDWMNRMDDFTGNFNGIFFRNNDCFRTLFHRLPKDILHFFYRIVMMIGIAQTFDNNSSRITDCLFKGCRISDCGNSHNCFIMHIIYINTFCRNITIPICYFNKAAG